MNNQLINIDNLQMPSISGTVSVPLSELDKMRVDHATAVKAAQELERHQSEVRIVYLEERVHTEYDYGRGGSEAYYNVKRLVEKSREYKGFDEFRETIRLEECNKYEERINTLRSDIDKKSKLIEAKNKANTELSDKVAKLEEIADKYTELSDLHDIVSSNLGVANKRVSELFRENEELRKKKSFWSFLNF